MDLYYEGKQSPKMEVRNMYFGLCPHSSLESHLEKQVL